MKRPTGLVIAAVLLILGSLLTLLMSALTVLGGMVAARLPVSAAAAPQPSWLPVGAFVFAGIGTLICAWGITTAVGILRIRAWARYSILVIGACVAVFSLISALSSSLLFFLPFPAPPAADPSQAQSAAFMMRFILGGILLFYAACCAIGTWWLFYFNRRAVRQLFRLPETELQPNPRPILISVLAVLNCIGAIICLIYAWLPVPAMMLGFALHGWQKVAVYLLFAGASGAIGWGLWRLREWGRRLALGLLTLGAVNSLVYIVRPSLVSSHTTEINRAMGLATTPFSPAFQSAMISYSMSLGMLFLVTIAAVLIYYRAAFRSSPALSA